MIYEACAEAVRDAAGLRRAPPSGASAKIKDLPVERLKHPIPPLYPYPHDATKLTNESSSPQRLDSLVAAHLASMNLSPTSRLY